MKKKRKLSLISRQAEQMNGVGAGRPGPIPLSNVATVCINKIVLFLAGQRVVGGSGGRARSNPR